MAYMIDGSNFLGHTSELGPKNPDAKLGLILRLLAFQQFTRKRIILFFDGAESPHFPDEEFKKLKFTVRHPERGTTADDVIKDMIDRRHDRRDMTLVSSDRELRAHAQERGVKVMSAKEFETQLKNILKERKKNIELRKETTRLSPLEMNLWQDAFKTKK